MAKSSIKTIRILGSSSEGDGTSTLVFKNKNKKKSKKGKRSTGVLRPLEFAVGIGTKTGKKVFSSYVDAHKKSNRKRRDGWLLDYPTNVIKSGTNGVKSLKIPTVLGI